MAYFIHSTLWTQRSTSLPPSTSTLTLSICSSTFFRSSERLEINIGNWFKLNVLVFLVMGGALRLHKNVSQVLHCSKEGPYRDLFGVLGPYWVPISFWNSGIIEKGISTCIIYFCFNAEMADLSHCPSVPIYQESRVVHIMVHAPNFLFSYIGINY